MTLQPLRATSPIVLATVLAWLAVAASAAQPNLLVGPTSLDLAVPYGRPIGPQSVLVESSEGSLTYQAKIGYWSTATGWLSITPLAGVTPATLAVNADTANLGNGVYFGYVEITSESAQSVILNVTLRIGEGAAATVKPAHLPEGLKVPGFKRDDGEAASLVVEPGTLSFGSEPSVQTIFIHSSGKALNYTASSDSGSWLAIGPQLGSTDGSNAISVAINPANLPAGVNTGFISVAASGAAEPVTIPITVNAPGGIRAALSAQPSQITFQGPLNGPVQMQSVSLTSTVAGESFSVGTTRNWLTVIPNSGSTPATLTVKADPSLVPAGGDVGTVLINSPSNSTDVAFISVTFNVTAGGSSTITASPSPVAVSVTAGNTATSTVQLSSSTVTNFNASVTSSSTPWLTVTPPSGTLPGSLTITVNAASLTAGTYSGTVTVTGGGASTAIPVNVTVTSSTVNTITATPPSVSLAATVGNSASSTVQLSSSTVSAFSASVTSTNTPWLTVTPASGSIPGSVTITASAAGLTAAGSPYNGTVTVTGGGASTDIPVTFAVSTSTITPSPTSLTFTANTPTSQSVQLTSPTSGVSFAATTTTPWLTLSPTTGVTPGTLTVSVSAAGLTPGNIYNGSVTITGGGGTLAIPVTYTVPSGAGSITALPTSVTFTQVQGAATPAAQTVQLTSATPTTFTASATQTWLTVTPTSGSTPTALTLSVNTTGLTVGTYNDTVTVNGGGSLLSIPVTLTILCSSTGIITANPPGINLSQIVGQSGFTVQSIALNSTPAACFSATSNASWLTISPTTGTTPNNLILSASPGMPAGTYPTSITVKGGVADVSIPVVLTIITAPNGIIATPTSVAFTQISGGSAPASQTVRLDSPNPTNFTVSNTQSWLTVTPTSGATPANLSLSVNPSSLATGSYQDTITITGGAAPVTIPVTFTISNDTFVPIPASLSFKQTLNGAAPSSQTIQLGSSTPRNYIAVPTVPWLSVSPPTGITSATLTVTANGTGMAVGSYQGAITVNGAGPALSIPVTLTIANASGAIFSPASLAFTYTTGDKTPPTQTVRVTSAGSEFSFTATATAGNSGMWLSVSVTPTGTTSTTPATLTVAVNPTGLTTGKYSGIITVTPTDSTIPPQNLPVTLTVNGGSSGLTFIRAILNAASLLPGPVAPGEIITVTGLGLGPTTGVGPNILASGAVDTMLAGTRLLFDGVAAPLLYVRADQINAIVPYNVYGRTGTSMQLELSGVLSDPVGLRVESTSPAMFTIDGSGHGQAAIVNQDGTINNASAPAPRGSIIAIYGTGEGQTSPAGQDGRIITTDLRAPLAPVSVKIGGIPAEVRYMGSAPGAVSGLFQLNVVVPATVVAGPGLAVDMTAGQVTTQVAATLAVR